ncbi:hypothetical protein GCM10028792_27950 [Salinisphaera aquimarina]
MLMRERHRLFQGTILGGGVIGAGQYAGNESQPENADQDQHENGRGHRIASTGEDLRAARTQPVAPAPACGALLPQPPALITVPPITYSCYMQL